MANIKLIAMALVELSTKETDELSKVLEEEYGIKPAFKVKKPSPERMFENKKALVSDVKKEELLAEAEKQRAAAKKWFVPNKIGKPCKVPPQRRK